MDAKQTMRMTRSSHSPPALECKSQESHVMAFVGSIGLTANIVLPGSRTPKTGHGA